MAWSFLDGVSAPPRRLIRQVDVPIGNSNGSPSGTPSCNLAVTAPG
jgi:hypothetical protein